MVMTSGYRLTVFTAFETYFQEKKVLPHGIHQALSYIPLEETA